jgi:hypothetical protein
MAQLIVKSTERKPVFPSTDFSGAHLWGDVIDIVADHLQTSHYTPDPFLVIKVAGEKADFEYLLEPLTEQVSEVDEEGNEMGPKGLLRKRYGLVLENLPSALFMQLCAVGTITLSDYQLDNITESRGV